MTGGGPPLLVITGPTASGKTQAALALARTLGGELIGADSVQIYRGFDIGSSKPTPEELDGVAHHLIDAVDATTEIDAAKFSELADAAIARARSRGKLPIVVGGSGLWLRALLRGLVRVPAVDPALRARLNREAQRLGSEALHRRLGQLDPLSARNLHPNDRVRIVRALEVHAQTGRALGALQAEHALGSPRYRALRVILDLPDAVLGERIRARTAQMLARGFADEVRGLIDRFGRDVRPLGAVGYREMVLHVCDGVPLETTQERIVRATRIYARRQRTWIKNEPGERWLTSQEQVLGDEGVARLRQFLDG